MPVLIGVRNLIKENINVFFFLERISVSVLVL